MARSVALDLMVVAGLATGGIAAAGIALAATEEATQTAAGAAIEPAAVITGNMADMELRYIQEDGPESGHVRVELTPETRSLTIIEARSAAQQGFLAALNQPGLGDNLSRITVVVRLMPASYADPSGTEQSFLFLHKGGQEWSVLSGD